MLQVCKQPYTIFVHVFKILRYVFLYRDEGIWGTVSTCRTEINCTVIWLQILDGKFLLLLRPSPSKSILVIRESSGYGKFKFKYPRNCTWLLSDCLYHRMSSLFGMAWEQLISVDSCIVLIRSGGVWWTSLTAEDHPVGKYQQLLYIWTPHCHKISTML